VDVLPFVRRQDRADEPYSRPDLLTALANLVYCLVGVVLTVDMVDGSFDLAIDDSLDTLRNPFIGL
jgi:hypothetical protein